MDDEHDKRISPLVEYFNALKTERKKKAWAKSIGTNMRYIIAIMYGYRRPSADMTIAIAKATKWQVTPHQIRPTTFKNFYDGLPPEVLITYIPKIVEMAA
jgi:DNA-binding transcriptional regulator YdaS (Cro superfamily)